MGLSEFRKLYEKELDSVIDFSIKKDHPALKSGSVVIDWITGIGGYPYGRITELYGDYGVGKTTLAICACREAQKAKKRSAYFDFEHAFDSKYAKKLGLDVNDQDTFLFSQPKHMSEGVDVIDKLCEYSEKKRKEGINLIVIDSVAAMIPKTLLEQTFDDSAKYIGLQARELSRLFARICGKIGSLDIAFLLINQVRDTIKLNKFAAGPDKDSTGGNALKFYSSLRLELSKLSDIMVGEGKEIGFHRVKTLARKNKVGDPFRKDVFVLRKGKGVDDTAAIVMKAEEFGLIEKMSNDKKYCLKNEVQKKVLVQGDLRKVTDWLLDPANSSVMQFISDQVKSEYAKRDDMGDEPPSSNPSSAEKTAKDIVEEIEL